jgi:hypothetical protein
MRRRLLAVSSALCALASVVLLATQIVTDDFNRADDSTGLGANWTIRNAGSGDVGWKVLSNKAQASALVGEGIGWYSGAGWTGGNDQYAEAAITALESGKDIAPVCRASGAAISSANGYLYDINDADAAVALGSSISTGLYKQVAGGFTQLGTSTSVTISANDVIRVECNGTTIRGLVNGVAKITQTDSSLASGNPGLYVGSGSTSTWDNFAAGTSAAAPRRQSVSSCSVSAATHP